MTLGEAAKAVGLAAGILILNLTATTAAVFVYALAIAPGHPVAFYQAAAPRIGAWSGPAGGAALFFLAGAWIGGRRPERNAVAFMLKTWLAYAVLDIASGAALGDAGSMPSWPMAASMALALLGGLAGAGLAGSRRRR
jgi:hypothetical protein